MTTKRILVLGYGNPGREDDGLGPALVECLEKMNLPEVTLDADYQLNIEDAVAMAEHTQVIFADASMTGNEPYAFFPIAPAPEISFSSHSVSPASVLAACEHHFHACPKAWVLGIRGYAFEIKEGLTPEARNNLEKALAFIRDWILA